MLLQRMLKLFFSGALIVLSFSCASMTKQSQALYDSPPDLKNTVQNSAPFINQAAGHCGPATLTMALQSAGFKSTLSEVTAQTYIPKKGTLQTDMITSARRQGAMAVQIRTLKDLLRELEAGYNVIAFQNLGLSWVPNWHYSLITGYDLQKKTLTMHSGPDANLVVDIKDFERNWNPADYWALVILPTGKLSVTATELDQAEAAAALEKAGQNENAKVAYLAILSRWPRNLVALIGLGNVFYKQQDFKRSVGFLKLAVEWHPQSEIAKHNLATAEMNLNKNTK